MAETSSKQQTRQLGIEALRQELQRRNGQLVQANRSTFRVIAPSATTEVGVWCSNGYGWQQSLTRFLSITHVNGRDQIALLPLQRPDHVHVLVWLGARHHVPNRFFMLKSSEVQEIVRAGHQWWIDHHGGTRPVKPESIHHNINVGRIEQFENRWALLGLSW